MNTSHLQTIIITSLHVALLLLLAPFINNFIKKIKAILQGRVGPPILQGYFDLIKYFHKETVVSDQTSWVFLTTPLIVFATTFAASILVPTFTTFYLPNLLGGIILLIYLFGLGRFFMATSAMEPNSGFCSMASSREMMLSTLIEPVMLLALFVFALMSGSTSLPNIVSYFSNHTNYIIYPSYLFAIFALFVAAIAEMGRVPFDNPETHYELTMIHEGLLLEYSGKELGLMFWSSWTKQLLILSLLSNLIFPWHFHSSNFLSSSYRLLFYVVEFLLFLLKLVVLCILVSLIETVFAKVRLFRVKDILVTSFVTAIIALVLLVKQNIGGFN